MFDHKDLADLDKALRAWSDARDSFRPTTHQLLAAQRLLLALADAGKLPPRRADLAPWLSPLFCGNAAQQAVFREIYADWVRRRFPDDSEPTPPPPVPPLPPPRLPPPPPPWPKVVIGVTLVLAAIIGWFACQFWWERTLRVEVTLDGQAAKRVVVKLGDFPLVTADDGFAEFSPVRRADLPLPLSVTLPGVEEPATKPGRLAGTAFAGFWNIARLWDAPRAPIVEPVALVGCTSCPPERSPPAGDPPPAPVPANAADLPLVHGFEVLLPPEPTELQRVVWPHAAVSALPALLLLLWLLYRLWYRVVRQPALRQLAASMPAKLHDFHLPGGVRELAPGLPLRRFAQELRRRMPLNSGELQLAATIQATLRRGGVFTPVRASRVEPDYLVLIDRACVADHLARLADGIVAELARADVKLECFDFDGEPTVCRPLGDQHDVERKRRTGLFRASAGRRVETLQHICWRHPDHRLLLITDGAGAFDLFTGEAQPWVELLLACASSTSDGHGSTWPAPVILTPVPVDRWSRREWALETCGFVLLPLDRLGFDILIGRLGGGSGPQHDHQPQKQRYEHERAVGRWLDIASPPRDAIDELIADLRDDLKAAGMTWLCALAAYPEIHWGITLRLGVALVPGEVEALLPRLARLVWLREARMPEWLRSELLKQLSAEEGKQVRELLLRLLEASTAQGDAAELPLRIASDAQQRPLRERLRKLRRWIREAPEESPLQDQVFLQFLFGSELRDTDLPLRNRLQKLGGDGSYWRTLAIAAASLASVLLATLLLCGLFPPWLAGSAELELLEVRVDPASGEVRALGLALLREGSDNPLPGTALLRPLRTRLGLDELRQPYALVGWHGDEGAWAAPRTLDDGAQAELPGAGALSADGKVAALALAKGATAVVRDGEKITVRSFRQPGGPRLSNDGETLALLQPGASYSVIKADIRDVSVDQLASEGISALAVAADGSRIARGGSGGQVSIASDPKYSEFAELATPLGQKITAIAFSANGARVAAGDASGQVAVWEVATGKRFGGGWSVSGHPVDSLALSADGARVAYADGLVITVRETSTGLLLGQALRAELEGQPFDLKKLPLGREAPSRLALGGRGELMQLDRGGVWRPLQIRDRSLRSFARAGSLWVAVGDGGAIGFSRDAGVSWQAATGKTTANLHGVAEAGGRWVAVGEAGTIVTSANGSDWELLGSVLEGPPGGLAALYAIAHGGGRWVAVGDRGTVLGSADGLGWERLTTGSRDDLRLVVHDGQRWLALGAAGAILTSDDGQAWQLAPGLALQVAGFSADGDHLALFERSGGVWVRAVVPKPPGDTPPTTQTARPPKAAKPPATPPKPAPPDQPVGKPPAPAQESPVRTSDEPPAEIRTPAVASKVRQTAGAVFRDCDQCPEMVVVPAGSFMMGSPGTEGNPLERPQHRVTFARPFAVGRYELTFDEWDACVADGGCKYTPRDQGWGRGRQPVINVSWDDAQAYVSWLAEKTGKPYRLLSEAEWEYAARAGARTAYPWGEEPGTNRANFSASGSQWSNKSTAPVGRFMPNAFGLYDMIGNVWEWTQDCRNEDYAGAPKDGSPWIEGSCGRRMVRGGAWSYVPENARAAERNWYAPKLRNGVLGFRLARTL